MTSRVPRKSGTQGDEIYLARIMTSTQTDCSMKERSRHQLTKWETKLKRATQPFTVLQLEQALSLNSSPSIDVNGREWAIMIKSIGRKMGNFGSHWERKILLQHDTVGSKESETNYLS